MPKQVSNSIPLLCNLCPKNPRFSDVSHLLTHISSKSHLSNRFKLQIRSQGEPEARRQLEDFDNWYSEYGLGDLLSERLAAKDQKKAPKRSRTSSAAVSVHHTQAKVEMELEENTNQTLAATPLYRPPIPRMHTWSTGSYAASFHSPPRLNPWNQEAVYATPTMKRNIPNFAHNQTPAPCCAEPVHTTPLRPDETEDENEKDTSKLKGVYWPGMDLFDTATAEMKRLRNQKKDGAILQQMKVSSMVVEPTEWIFNADGEFRRARDIFDESDDSSAAISEATLTPKKRRTRKKPLVEISANMPRLQTAMYKQPTKKAVIKRKSAASKLDEVARKKQVPSNHLSLLTSARFAPNSDENGDYRLTMEDFGKQRRVGIFRDAEVNSPGRTESPLEDHRFDFSNSQTAQHDRTTNVLQNSPTPMSRPASVRFGGKENMEPGHMNQRLMSTTASGFTPQVYRNDSYNPLFYHSHAHTFVYGDRPSFQSEVKAGSSGFDGDFKPMMIPNSFRNMVVAHGLPANPGRGMCNDLPFPI